MFCLELCSSATGQRLGSTNGVQGRLNVGIMVLLIAQLDVASIGGTVSEILMKRQRTRHKVIRSHKSRPATRLRAEAYSSSTAELHVTSRSLTPSWTRSPRRAHDACSLSLRPARFFNLHIRVGPSILNTPNLAIRRGIRKSTFRHCDISHKVILLRCNFSYRKRESCLIFTSPPRSQDIATCLKRRTPPSRDARLYKRTQARA